MVNKDVYIRAIVMYNFVICVTVKLIIRLTDRYDRINHEIKMMRKLVMCYLHDTS